MLSKKQSKIDLIIGVLVLIAGIIIYEFAPVAAAPGAGGLFMAAPAHVTSHYIGSAIAIIFGVIGLALYKKLSKVGRGVSVLSIIMGVVFLLDAPGMPLYPILTPHGQAMALTGGITALVGLIGIIGAVAQKPTTTTITTTTTTTTKTIKS